MSNESPPKSVRSRILEDQSFVRCPNCRGTGWVPPDDSSLEPTRFVQPEDVVTVDISKKGDQ